MTHLDPRLFTLNSSEAGFHRPAPDIIEQTANAALRHALAAWQAKRKAQQQKDKSE